MSNNRLVLCTFYEKRGKIFDSNLFYLKSLLPFSKKIILIVNGAINESSNDKIKQLGIQTLIRENRGLDFGAWQEAILYLGWDEICKYDEILITNLTCYGPVYSFQEMFDEMNTRDCDFWGINRHPARPDIKLIPSDPSSSIQEHIQSYFIIFKRKVILSESFKNFWENLKQVESYQEEVAYHESRLTFFFESCGFKSSTYMPFKKYCRTNENAALLEGYNQLVEDRNPLIKKKIFSLRQEHWMQNGNWGQCSKILGYIKKRTSYPSSYIVQEMLATVPMSTIQTNLHLTYSISHSKRNLSIASTVNRIGLVLFVYYEDQVRYMVSFISNLPKSTSIYLLSAKSELLNVYQNQLKERGFVYIEKRITVPQGRDVSAYIVGAIDVYKKHEYVCCLHDKKTAQAGYLVGMAYRNHNIENLVPTEEYILNVINIFDNDPYLGMLVPPTFPLALGNEMGNSMNRHLLLQLFEDYHVQIPFDEIPLAPYGSMFWVRGKAFETLYRRKLTYNDFPREPIPNDGTILHAYERFYPALVQEAGFYTGWCGSSEYLKQYFDLAFYVWREYQKRLYCLYGYLPFDLLLTSLVTEPQIFVHCGVRRALYNLMREFKFKFFSNKQFPRLSSIIRKILRM